MADEKAEKKFANLHYPGIKANPDEGKAPLAKEAKWRFEKQMECIGEAPQRALLAASVLFASASPICLATARALASMGVGRIGIVGDEAHTGAHLVPASQDPEPRANRSLSLWMKTNAPWSAYEGFSFLNVEREFEDVARGFDFIVSDSEEYSCDYFIGVWGRQGCVVRLDKKTKPKKPAASSEPGLFYPLVDAVALDLSMTIFNRILNADDKLKVVHALD